MVFLLIGLEWCELDMVWSTFGQLFAWKFLGGFSQIRLNSIRLVLREPFSRDLKSLDRKVMPVRSRLRAPSKSITYATLVKF
jgi:hypothetical protein